MTQSVIGSIRVNLGIDTAAFQKGLRDAQKNLRVAGRRLTSIGEDLSLKVSAPLLGIGGLAIKAGADFEAAFNRIGAVTGAPVEQIDALAASARELGRTTQFSATEAAEAVEILAKNGLSAAQILDGALAASLQLAAAGGTDLASAGDLATDVMLNFGKAAGEMSSVVDGISGVLVNSKFGIDDYRLAIAQAGGVAGGVGVSFEEFNAVIAATSNLFASGSDAGTSYKTFLQRLNPQSKEAAALMEQLGLEFFDAQGNIRSMAEIAGVLQDSLADLSEEARNDALSTIFGTDAMRTAIGLMQQGTEGVERLDAAIGQASATEQAAARMEGFSGAVRRLRSAFEGLLLAISDSGLLDSATRIVEALTGITSKISEADPKLVQFGLVFAGLAAAIGPVILVMGAFAAALGAAALPVAGLVAGVSAITAAVVAFWPEIRSAADSLGEFWTGLRESEGAAGVFVQSIESAFGVLRDYVSFNLNVGRELIDALIAGITGNIDGVRDAFSNVGQLARDYFGGLAAEFTQIGRDVIDGLLAGLRERVSNVKEWFSNLGGDIAQWTRDKLGIKSPSRVFAEIGQNILDGLNQGMNSKEGETKANIERIAGETSDAFRRVTERLQSDLASVGAPDIEQRITTELETAGVDRATPEGNEIVDYVTQLDAVQDRQDAIESRNQVLSRSFTNLFRGALDGAEGFNNALSGVLDNLSSMLISNAFQGLFGGGFFGGGGSIPAYASGTNFHPGGWALVGERGPELVDLPRGSSVIPNDMLGGGGQTITFAPQIDNRGASVEAVARGFQELQRQQEEFRQTFAGDVINSVNDPRYRGRR